MHPLACRQQFFWLRRRAVEFVAIDSVNATHKLLAVATFLASSVEEGNPRASLLGAAAT